MSKVDSRVPPASGELWQVRRSNRVACLRWQAHGAGHNDCVIRQGDIVMILGYELDPPNDDHAWPHYLLDVLVPEGIVFREQRWDLSTWYRWLEKVE